MKRFFGKTNIDFQGKRHIALTISGIVILIGLISLVLHGGPNYSIDFEGGLAIILRISEQEGQPPIDEEMVRSTLNKINLENSEVKMSRSSEGEDLMVRLKEEARFKPPEALIRSSLEVIVQDDVWKVVPDDQIEHKGLPDLQGISYVAVETDISKKKLQSALDSAAVDNPQLIEHKNTEGNLIWLLTGEGRDAASKLYKALTGDYPDYMIVVRSIDRVGPRIGAELRLQAILSIFAALGLIIVYLWWRFELLFGIAAVAALFHDVLITLGVFSLLNLEISVTIIGAFLTLVGYSLNDTIVVFDRIRENLKRYKDANYGKVINRSINDNLSRTAITSMTTFMVVLVVFIKGGEVLHSFSLALLVGIVVGTYSSIYIASPILVEWAERTGLAAGRKKKKG